MDALLLLLLVFTCNGLAKDLPETHQLNLQAPELKRLETKDDPNNITSHQIITWTSVENDDASDPVIGYKLKIWELKKIKRTVYKSQGGEFVPVVEESYPKIDNKVIPDGVPNEIITPADQTTATFRDAKVDVAYQFAVLAFTARGEGRLSAPVRLMLHDTDEMKKETK